MRRFTARKATVIAAALAVLTCCAPRGPIVEGAGMEPHRQTLRTMPQNEDLLYLSSGVWIYVYDLKGAVPPYMIGGLWGPSGMCVNSAGDIWVTESGSGEVVRFLHGGTSVVSTLHDPKSRPLGCAVDRTTGNVAVSSSRGPQPFDPGDVAVFPRALDNPIIYRLPDLMFYFFCTYDDSGNLFVDGQDHNFDIVIAKLPKGGTRMSKLAVRGLPPNFHYPGGIFWDGQYLVVGDYDRGIIYRLKVTGPAASVVSSTRLLESSGLDQFFIGRLRYGFNTAPVLVAPNNMTTTAMIWNYPAGGEPIQTLGNIPYFIGAVISSSVSGSR